ncbi:ESPR-type extended signal peptide-containing protein, partial [Haemophilus parahaemolyticus]
MNKIFRVVWSQATQSWVVVSELTKAHKKQSSSNAQKSAVTFSGNFIKSSAIALALLSGHSAYAAAALNDAGTGSGAVAWGTGSEATATDSVAIGKGAKAENANAIAIGGASKASGDSDIALGNQANAENKNTVAIGRESKASGESGIALGYQATADKQFTVAIGAGASSQHNNAVAIGLNAKALGPTSLAFGMRSKATGNDSYAIGLESESIGETSISFGYKSKASKNYDIVFGREANTLDQGSGYSIAIGYGAMSGTNKGGKNLNGNDAGGIAIGTGAYTGVNKNNISVNSSVAVGAGAGAGFRKLDAKNNNMPAENATDVDNNNEVLKKAFGVKNVADYQPIAGGANGYTNVEINEATALGRNARAIGDQSVAIGAQTIAGHGAVALGGNDITQFANKKYYKSTKEDFAVTETIDHNQDAKISDKTISATYNDLVGTRLDTAYKATYAQDGSVVLGAQAHSSTPLGTALGTNALIRKGAFGATAIGAGSQVQANAEAAVAIGMGSFADGKYAVAAGTAARAKESAVAAGYKAKAEESAVAVGDSSEATTSSVAVGQGAKAEQVSDIAIGQGAKAKGEQGAIAMGLGTIAQGHSSIMIGGADISTAAKQVVEYSKEKVREDGTPELGTETITEVINGKTVKRDVKIVKTETVTGEKLSNAYREITGYNLDTDSLNYGSPDNKNGHASISMGIHSLSKGAMGVAIGTAARADALGSMALGTGAHASMQNSVAIGTGAVADKVSKGTRQTDISYDEDGNVVETGSLKAKYTFRWAGGINTSEGDVVSFGTPGAERQLKNVAAGRVAQDSTDAVNGSQLNAITRSLSQTITNGWQVGGNNKFRVSNIGSNERVNFLDGLGTAVNIAEINQAEDIEGHKLVKIGSDFYKASDFNDKGELNAGAQKVAAAEIKKQPAGANVTFDVKEVNSTLSVTPVGLKVTTGEVTANSDGTMNTPNNTTKADNTRVTAAMNAAETALVDSQTTWRKKSDAYQQTELAYLAADTALTKGKEAVGTIEADIEITKQELKTAQDILAKDQAVLAKAEKEVERNPNDTQKQSELNKAREKVGDSQFVVDQRGRKLTQQEATLTDRQNRVTVLEQEKTKAETVRNTAKGVYEDANNDLNTKKEAFKTAKEAFVAAGANQIATVQNVADSINASGWTLQQGTNKKDLVQPGDKVAFVDGNGTTVTVTTDAEGKRSEIKFDVDKADLTTTAGKVVAPDVKALKEAVTEAEKEATANPTDTAKQKALADAKAALAKEENKVVTAQNVAEAINNAGFNLKTSATTGGEKLKGTKDDGELIKPSNTVEMVAGKNLTVKQDESGKVTFATKDNVSFSTVQIGGDEGPKLAKAADGSLKVSDKDGTNPVKMTNVKDGDVSATSTDAINGSQFHAVAKNTIKLAGQNGDATATETDGQELDKKGGIKFTVKSSDGALLDVAAKGDTITLTPKVGSVTTNASGVPTADVTNGKLVTAEELVTALKGMGWKATAGKDGTGTVADASVELIKAGETVTFKAGDNLAVKQAGKEFIYSLQKELTGLTSAEFKDANNNAVKITPEGITITKPADATGANGKTVTLNQNGLDNGGNAITNVAGNLPNTQNSNTANTAAAPSNATKSQAAPTLGTGANQVNPNNAATVGDVLNAGWNLKGNGAEVDFVKAYDTVDFVNGDGTTTSVESKDGKTSTVKYSVNLGDGLEKDATTNKIKVKAADKSLEVTNDGVKVKAADNTLTTDTNGLKVNTGSITTAAVPTVTAGNENKIATVGNVADAIKAAAWNATSAATTSGENTGTKVQPVKAGETVTFEADKNIKIAQADGKFTFSTKDNVEFNTVKVGTSDKAANGKKPVNLTTEAAKDASNNDDANKPTTALNISSGTGTDAKPTQLVGVGSVLNKTTINTTPTGTVPAGSTPAVPTTADLVNLTEAVNKNAAATVGDLQNMGWKVSSDKATGAEGAYLDVVKNANEVKFVGEGTAIVSGKTEGDVRTITVKVDDQVSTNNAVTPVVYTKADGTKVYPVKNAHGDIEYHTTPDGKGAGDQKVDDGDVITSVNGPKGATTPTTLSNVAGNLNGAKTGTTAPTTSATKPTALTETNAATVGDVLNAGWNLQGNGQAVDFVKPFDTVNFVNGKGTTVTATASADGTVNEVKVDVDTAALTTDKGKVKAPDVKALKEAVTEAEKEATANPTDTAKQKALADAKAALAKEE